MSVSIADAIEALGKQKLGLAAGEDRAMIVAQGETTSRFAVSVMSRPMFNKDRTAVELRFELRVELGGGSASSLIGEGVVERALAVKESPLAHALVDRVDWLRLAAPSVYADLERASVESSSRKGAGGFSHSRL